MPRALGDQGPELAHQRIAHQRGNRLPGPLAKQFEAVAIDDRAFLEGDFGRGAMVGHALDARFGNRAGRHAQRRRFNRVAVDGQVHRHAAVPLCQSAQHEVLEPHAGMKQLRLVPGHEHGRCPSESRQGDVAVSAGVVPGCFEQLAARVAGQVGQRPATDVVVVGCRGGGVVFHQFADSRQRWIDQGAAAFGRSTQATLLAGLAHQLHPETPRHKVLPGAWGFAAPARASARSNT